MTQRTTKLYYEAHITIDPVFGARRLTAQDIASARAFRVAKLILRKDASANPEEHTDDTFMTGHSINFVDIMRRTKALCEDLKQSNFVVRRYKIEETVMDSRIEDEMELLK